jgi:hypothetical protein
MLWRKLQLIMLSGSVAATAAHSSCTYQYAMLTCCDARMPTHTMVPLLLFMLALQRLTDKWQTASLDVSCCCEISNAAVRYASAGGRPVHGTTGRGAMLRLMMSRSHVT